MKSSHGESSAISIFDQAHVKILRELSASRTASWTLNGHTYNASPPLLILLELIFEYLKIAKEIGLLAGDLTEAIFGCIRLFAVGASKNVLECRRPVGLRSLGMSGSSLYFDSQLVPFIKSELKRTDAPQDLVEKCSSIHTLLARFVGSVRLSIRNPMLRR
jgi:hypothetical protein